MKKLIAALSAPLISLLLPTLAFADLNDFDPCSAGAHGGILGTGCNTTSFGVIFGNLINFIFVVAVIIALGFLIYGGIRWITSGGDKGGVETARNTIIAAIVGLVIIVLAYFILNALVLPFLGVKGGFSGLKITPITNGNG